MENNSFKERFTLSELLWLGGVFGYESFPVISSTVDNSSDSQSQIDLNNAEKSLADRGFVKIDSKGKYQVEALAYLIVSWLAQPDTVFAFETYSNYQNRTRSIVLSKDDHVLQVDIKESQYDVAILPDIQSFISEFLFAYGTNLPKEKESLKHKLPVGSPFDLIKMVKSSTDKGIEKLHEVGISPAEASATVQWLEKIEKTFIFSKYQWVNSELVLDYESTLFTDSQSFWESRFTNKAKSFYEVFPTQPDEILLKLFKK